VAFFHFKETFINPDKILKILKNTKNESQAEKNCFEEAKKSPNPRRKSGFGHWRVRDKRGDQEVSWLCTSGDGTLSKREDVQKGKGWSMNIPSGGPGWELEH
jgi:hypothetical protein